ncbi:MAG: membrane dipeptidase [Pseudomonadota bacterium]
MADPHLWDQCFAATENCGAWPKQFAMLSRMHGAGYRAVSITVAYDPDDALTALNRITLWRQLVRDNQDRYRLLLESEDAGAARASGHLAVNFHFQGTTPFGRDLGLVETFYALGVRFALLTYNRRNHAADGCHDIADVGLSDFGRDLIVEMQRTGMIVDLSHTGTRSALQAFERAKRPMIYSHANAHALMPHDRNITDELAKACAATGGVIGVNGVNAYLAEGPATADCMFAHIDHWVTLLGPQHVGIGSDCVTDMTRTYESMAARAAEWPADQGYHTGDLSTCMPEDIAALRGRMNAAGYPADAVDGIMGGNWQRIANACWS